MARRVALVQPHLLGLGLRGLVAIPRGVHWRSDAKLVLHHLLHCLLGQPLWNSPLQQRTLREPPCSFHYLLTNKPYFMTTLLRTRGLSHQCVGPCPLALGHISKQNIDDFLFSVLYCKKQG